MNTSKLKSTLKRVAAANRPELADLEYLLGLTDDRELALVYQYADEVRAQYCGSGIWLRGVVEFSSYCRNNCLYCGLNAGNKDLPRYRLNAEEILAAAEQIAGGAIKTIVLQSGEDPELDPLWLRDLIIKIKSRFDLAVTLSVGERSRQDYYLWRAVGADRYLLKIETSDRKLYESLHPDMSFTQRLRCLGELKDLGYQVGSGNIVGLKGQSLKQIARDILFFQENDFDMIGIGPFIPHQATALAAESKADLQLTLKTLALTRIVTKNTYLPATTALGSLGADYRREGLKAGANVLMPNFTPQPYRKYYEIYPGKRCINENAGDCGPCMEIMAGQINRNIDYSVGHTLKRGGEHGQKGTNY